MYEIVYFLHFISPSPPAPRKEGGGKENEVTKPVLKNPIDIHPLSYCLKHSIMLFILIYLSFYVGLNFMSTSCKGKNVGKIYYIAHSQ